MEPTQKMLERKFKPLTPIQAEILELYDQGLRAKAIATRIGWSSPRSIDHQIEYALNKVGRYK